MREACRDQNQSGKNIRNFRLIAGVLFCLQGMKLPNVTSFSTQNRLVAPVVPNSCLVLPGLRKLHLSSVWREIGQHNLSDIGEGIKKVTVNRFVNNLYMWKKFFN